MSRGLAPVAPPRRPFYGWVILALSFAFLAFAYSVWYSFSVFFVALLQEFGWPRADTAGAYSLFVALHGLVGIFSGGLADRFGPKVIIAGGGVILAAALAGCSTIATPWQLYLFFGVGCAIGVTSVGWVPTVTLVQRWFRQRLGLALGVASSGIGLGIIAGAPALQALITALGWRGAYLVSAAVMLVVPPVALLFVRGRPEELGQQPDGVPPRGAEQPRDDDARVVDRAWASQTWTVRSAARTWRFWLMMLTFGASSFTVSTVFVHQVALLTDAGYDAFLAASVVGLMGAVSVAGKIGWGAASDRLGREVVYTLGAGSMLGGLALLAIADRVVAPWFVIVYGVTFAVGYSVSAIVTPTVTTDLFSGRSFGAVYGVIQFGSGIGSALGAWLAGLIFDRTGDYHAALAVAGMLCAASVVGIWHIAPRKVRLAPGRVPRSGSAGLGPTARGREIGL